MSCCLALVSGLMSTALLVTSAAATPTWLPASPLETATSNPVSGDSVAMDATGDLVAGWNEVSAGKGVIRITSRPAGGPYATAQTLSESGADVHLASVGVDSRGGGYAFIATGQPGAYVPSISMLVPGQSPWTPPTHLASFATTTLPSGDVDANGDVAMIYIAASDGSLHINYKPQLGGFVGDKAVLGTPGPVSEATTSVAGDGSVHIALLSGGRIYEADQAVGGTGSWAFNGPINPTSDIGISDLKIFSDATGDAALAWIGGDGNVVEAHRDDGGPFSAPKPVTTQGSVAGLRGTIDEAGTVTLAWARATATGSVIEAASRTPGDPGFAVDIVASGTDLGDPAVAESADGSAVLAWRSPASGSPPYSIYAARRTSSAGWSNPATPLSSGSGGPPAVAMDIEGDGVAAWATLPGGGLTQPVAAGFDAAGPQLRRVAYPAGSAAGIVFSFSVVPVDVWSPVRVVSWAFGDGGTASGATGRHSYADVGKYTWSLTASDSLGNARTVGGAVAVGPAPSLDLPAVPPDTPGPAPAGKRISLTHLRVSPSRFAVANRGASIATARGSRLTYVLSGPATTSLVIARATAGVRSGRKCVKPSRLRQKGARRCTRFVTVGTFRHVDRKGGSVRLKFTGRFRGRSLRAARYRLTAQATASGIRSGRASATFRIVRSPRKRRAH